MHFDIQAKGFDLTEGLREHSIRRLQFALGWAHHDLSKVAVRLSDINGPRGGNDKRCQIRIPVPRAQSVVIEDTASDIHVAIDRAAERAGKALERRLSRKREFEHVRGLDLPGPGAKDSE